MWGFWGWNPESQTNWTFGHPSSVTQQLTSWPPDDAFASDNPFLCLAPPAPPLSPHIRVTIRDKELNVKFSVMFLFLHFWNFSSLSIPKQFKGAISTLLGTYSLKKEVGEGIYSLFLLCPSSYVCGGGDIHHILCTSSCSPIPYKGERVLWMEN